MVSVDTTRGLYRRAPRITLVGPKSTRLSLGDTGRKQTRGRRPHEDTGRGQGDGATSPGLPGGPRSWRGREGPQAPAGSTAADTLTLDCEGFCGLSRQHAVLCPVALKNQHSVLQVQTIPLMGSLRVATEQTCMCQPELGFDNWSVDGGYPGYPDGGRPGLVSGPRARGSVIPHKGCAGPAASAGRRLLRLPHQDGTCRPILSRRGLSQLGKSPCHYFRPSFECGQD